MGNNPISFNDPEGDLPPILLGALIGAVMHTGTHLATNKFTFNNWNWGDFAGSIVAGGVGGGLSPALTKAGIGGFAAGAITGGASGFSQNLTTGLINGNLSLGGLAKNTFMGAGIGGMVQGIAAAIDGRDFFDGSKVIDSKTIAYDETIPGIKQIGTHNCGPANVAAIDQSLGGNLTQDKARGWFGGDPNQDGIGDIPLWKKYTEMTGISHVKRGADPGLISQFSEMIDDGYKISINLKTNSTVSPGHSVVMKGVKRKTILKVNGRISSKLMYQVMDPEQGTFKYIPLSKIKKAHKIFYVPPQ